MSDAECPNEGYHGGCHYPDCGPKCEGYRRKHPSPPAGVETWTQDRLRKLVDVVWNAATESTTVPSTDWADRLIAQAAPNEAGLKQPAGEWPSEEELARVIYTAAAEFNDVRGKPYDEQAEIWKREVRHIARAVLSLPRSPKT